MYVVALLLLMLIHSTHNSYLSNAFFTHAIMKAVSIPKTRISRIETPQCATVFPLPTEVVVVVSIVVSLLASEY
jgi:hypothetical protein